MPLPKFDIDAATAFGRNFLESAGKIYLTREQIKQMKEQEKRLTKQHEDNVKLEKFGRKFQIAKILHEAKQKQKEATEPLRGSEFKSQMEGEILETYLKPIRAKMEKGEPITDQDLKNLYMYRSYRKSDVSGMPQGGGAGGATQNQLLTRLNAIDLELGELSELYTKRALVDPTYGIVTSHTGDMRQANNYEELNAAYDKAKTEVEQKIAEGKGLYTNSALNDLHNYYSQLYDRLYVNYQMGRISTSAPAPTNAPVPDEDGILDEIRDAVQ